MLDSDSCLVGGVTKMSGISSLVGCLVGVTSGEVSKKGYFVGVSSGVSEVGGVRGGGGEDEGGGGEETRFKMSSSLKGGGLGMPSSEGGG